jgi:hypothetical protein
MIKQTTLYRINWHRCEISKKITRRANSVRKGLAAFAPPWRPCRYASRQPEALTEPWAWLGYTRWRHSLLLTVSNEANNLRLGGHCEVNKALKAINDLEKGLAQHPGPLQLQPQRLKSFQLAKLNKLLPML